MPSACEPLGVADARELEELRRADRAGGEDHLAGARGARSALAAAPEAATPVARPSSSTSALDLRAGLEPEVGPAQHRPQEALAALQRRPRFWLTWK